MTGKRDYVAVWFKYVTTAEAKKKELVSGEYLFWQADFLPEDHQPRMHDISKDWLFH